MQIEVQVLGISLQLATDEALFSPRGLDAGTRAMLETAVVTAEDRVLDLGCGYGVVGLALAKAYEPQSVTMVDADPLAVQVADGNVAAAGMDQASTDFSVLHSDGFAQLTGKMFTVILSNPPYHTDFAVAKRFIEDGFAHLELGGSMYIVVKRRTWYESKLRTVFGGVSVTEKDGYWVLMAQKRTARPPAPAKKAVATTRKHAKRQAEATGKRRKRRRFTSSRACDG